MSAKEEHPEKKDTEAQEEEEEEEEEYEEPPTDAEKVPVTIITGFLGSGKTTLLNYILKEQHGKKIAVIENEFGQVDIDSQLVKDTIETKEDIVAMDNGCMCCTVRGDLVKALIQLDRKAQERGAPFDAILIETTGLADPAPVAFTFFANPYISQIYRIDAILCLVDAKHIKEHLLEKKADDAVNEAVQQVAFADRILLNKIDLVTQAEKEDVIDMIRSINASAELFETQQSRVSLDHVLGIGSFSVERTLELDPDFLQDDEAEHEHDCGDPDCGHPDHKHGHSHDHDHKCDEHCTHDHGHKHEHKHSHDHGHGEQKCDEHCTHDHDHDHGHSHHEHKHSHGDHEHGHEHKCDEHCTHDHAHAHEHGHKKETRKRKKHDLSGVTSVGIKMDGYLDTRLFNLFMMTVLNKRARDIYRSKGLLAMHGQEDKKFIFQGVHETLNFGPANEGWKEGETPTNILVLIGRNLDKPDLEAKFRACKWEPLPAGWELKIDFKAPGGPAAEDDDPVVKYVHAETGEERLERPKL